MTISKIIIKHTIIGFPFFHRTSLIICCSDKFLAKCLNTLSELLNGRPSVLNADFISSGKIQTKQRRVFFVFTSFCPSVSKIMLILECCLINENLFKDCLGQ